MFSESPPLKRKNSDQNPPKTEATSACAEALNEELLHFMAGGFIPLDEFRENNRICKAKLNQIRLKHRSEEIRNVNSRKVDWFGNIR
ncbi:hypothetical protein, partial [Pseudarthrobacter sp. NamB4]|uniref:hypothetical protein n=1 Tax=Pseudarthrobacter sp. NamB4 TaxID=2576837 RepID=UPI0010FDC481